MEEEARSRLIVTGIRELDEKIGGGIPIGSLGLIEGQSGAGKSVLSQHFVYGALTDAMTSVAYYTTENTIKSLIGQMDSLSLTTLDYFLSDVFRIFPLALRSDTKHTNKRFHLLTKHFKLLPKQFTLIIIDSITLLLAHGDQVSIIDFFSSCKDLCARKLPPDYWRDW